MDASSPQKHFQPQPLKKRKVAEMNGQINSLSTREQNENNEQDIIKENEDASDQDYPLDFSRKNREKSQSPNIEQMQCVSSVPHCSQNELINFMSKPSSTTEQIQGMSSESGYLNNVHNKIVNKKSNFELMESCQSYSSPEMIEISAISRSNHPLNNQSDVLKAINRRESHSPIKRLPLPINSNGVNFISEELSNMPLNSISSFPSYPIHGFPVNPLETPCNILQLNSRMDDLRVSQNFPASSMYSSMNLTEVPRGRQPKNVRPFNKITQELNHLLPIQNFAHRSNFINSPPPAISSTSAHSIRENNSSPMNSQDPGSDIRIQPEATVSVNGDHRFDSQNKPDTQQSSRRKGQKLPDEQKDEVYWEKRRKNNEAAKRSRDLRRYKEDRLALAADYFGRQNVILNEELSNLKNEIKEKKQLILNLQFENTQLKLLLEKHISRTPLHMQMSRREIAENRSNASQVEYRKLEGNPGL